MWWLILSGAVHNFNLYAHQLVPLALPDAVSRHEPAVGAGWSSMMVYGVGGGLGLLLGGMAADAAVRRRADGRLLVARAAPSSRRSRSSSSPWAGPEATPSASACSRALSIVFMYVYYPAVYAAIQDVVGPALRGTAMALYFLAMYVLGASLGPAGHRAA